mgnify:CR=1 FL=1
MSKLPARTRSMRLRRRASMQELLWLALFVLAALLAIMLGAEPVLVIGVGLTAYASWHLIQAAQDIAESGFNPEGRSSDQLIDEADVRRYLLGSGLAALGGVLAAPSIGLSTGMGALFLLTAIVAAMPQWEIGFERDLVIPSSIRGNHALFAEVFGLVVDMVESVGEVEFPFDDVRRDLARWRSHHASYCQIALKLLRLDRV